MRDPANTGDVATAPEEHSGSARFDRGAYPGMSFKLIFGGTLSSTMSKDPQDFEVTVAKPDAA